MPASGSGLAVCRREGSPPHRERQVQEQLGIRGTSRSVGVSVSDIHSIAIECNPNLVEPLDAPGAPIGELVVSIPTPGRDHRKHVDPALAKQALINSWIVFADLLGCMGNVKL